MNLNIILAVDDKYGYSLNDKIPWNYREDLKHFRQKTLNTILIMGKKTWDSIPNKDKFVERRLCFVLSRSFPDSALGYDDWHDFGNYYFLNSYELALDICKGKFEYDDIFVIGGKELYMKALQDVNLQNLFVTRVKGDYKCDKTIPELHDIIQQRCKMINRSIQLYDGSPVLIFEDYEVVSEEGKYLTLMKDILNTGINKTDRTCTGTISKFDVHLSFSLKNNTLPLLTTKRTYWKGILHELLWFLNGQTNANLLKEKGVHIWDGNSSREFLDKCNFKDRDVGDLGPVYGFQWRHWGAEYTNMYENYTNKGIDQIKNIIKTIKNDPDNRRIILNAWNVNDIDKMCLPPCHMMCQFYVNTDTKELSCKMYQRSADMFLGVPFNIASYATLTHIIAKLTNLNASMLHITIGDAHIYNTHIEAVNIQLERMPKPFPVLKIVNRDDLNIDNLTYDDFEVLNYNCESSIKGAMAV